jgi:hypothetical protein
MEKTCSRCGKTFGCGSGAPGCWCEDVQLENETLQQLRDSFANCLCPPCLRAYQSPEKAGTVSGKSEQD